MSPRVDRWGDPIEDEIEVSTTRSPRACWRCGVVIEPERYPPVCDSCEQKREDRAARAERQHAMRNRLKAEVRPRDPDALRRRAYKSAVSQGLITPRPPLRHWWEGES